MQCDAEKFYTDHAGLLKYTIKILKYLPALQKLWKKNLIFYPRMRILDVGCGTGALTKTLYEATEKRTAEEVDFFAFDVTKKLLDEFTDWIQEKEIINIRVAKADIRSMAEQLPFHWRDFDLICSSGVLEYLTEKELFQALKRFYQKLKEGGRLVTMGSHKHCVNAILIRGLYQANLYSKNRFRGLLRRAGFEKITYWKFPFPYSYLNLWGYIAVAEK